MHLPYAFFPDASGGTEVYVLALAQRLAALGVESVIAAPAPKSARYTHEGVPVRRFALGDGPPNLRDLYGEGDPHAAANFAALLDEERPSLVHLHALSSGVSLRVVREARRRALPVVFTYHTPTVSCQRGTLLHLGREVCDGVLRRGRCTRCTLQGLGLDPLTRTLVGALPPAVGSLVARTGQSGGAWTALRMSELLALRHATFHALMGEVDQVVALCGWIETLLCRNGVPASKIARSRHGLASPLPAPREVRPRAAGEPPRAIFLGRLDPTKGPDLLLRALRADPSLPLQLDLYGIEQGGQGGAYRQELDRLRAGDSRIRFYPPVPPSQVLPLLAGYDMLLVPSRTLETGPLVVLEAFAVGVPVLGSRLGGIADWVADGTNGLLVAPDSVAAWGAALRRVAEEANLLARLAGAIAPPRSMGEVAAEMLALYRPLLAPRREASPSPAANPTNPDWTRP